MTTKKYSHNEIVNIAPTKTTERSTKVRFEVQEKAPEIIAEKPKEPANHADLLKRSDSLTNKERLEFLCKNVTTENFDPKKCDDFNLKKYWVQLTKGSSQEEKDEYLKKIKEGFRQRVNGSL